MAPPLDPMTAPTVIALASVARDVTQTYHRALIQLRATCHHKSTTIEGEDPDTLNWSNYMTVCRVCENCGLYSNRFTASLSGDERLTYLFEARAMEVTPDKFKRTKNRLRKIGLL